MFFLCQALQKKTFDSLFGLYQILLEERKREQRKLGNGNHSTDLVDIENEYVHIEDMPLEIENFHLQHQASQSTTSNPLDSRGIGPMFSNGDDNSVHPADLQKYLSSRRHTFAVALNPQDVERITVESNDTINIPEISRRSPTPPPGDQKKLSYKEQFLPCPAVLQVRPSYDRRASDGSASIQSSIAQFHALRKARKAFNQVSNYDDSSSSSNQSSLEQLLGVPSFKDDDRDSGSDQEPDLEAVARYLKGRGRQQRHTLGCTIDPPPTLAEDGVPDSFCALPQRRTALVPTRERERASPVPYGPSIASSGEGRSRYHRRSSEGNTGAVLKASLGQIGEHPDPMKHLQAEFLKLQQLYGNKTEQQYSRQRRNQTQIDKQVRKRDTPSRHSYPKYQDIGAPSYEEAMTQNPSAQGTADVPVKSTNTDQVMSEQDELLLLRMKQEEEMQRLRQEQLFKHKLLLKRQQEEQRELIRRASGGSPNLEASIETFLKMKGLAPESKAATVSPPVSGGFQQQPEQLQEQMQRLNLRIPEINFPGVTNDPSAQVNPLPFHSQFTSRQSSTPTVPDEPHLGGHIRQKSAPAGVPYTESTKQMDVDVSRVSDEGELQNEGDQFPNMQQPEFPQAAVYFPFAMHPLFITTNATQPPSPLLGGHNGSLVTSPVSPTIRRSCNAHTVDSLHMQRLVQNNNNANLETSASSYWTSLMQENLDKGNGIQQQGNSCCKGEGYMPNKEVSHPLRTAISYDMTSEKEIAFIVSQIQVALDARQQTGLDYSKSDAYFSLFGNGVQMEIEVSNVPGSDLNGIKLRKVDGDTWVYKKMCSELLSVIKV